MSNYSMSKEYHNLKHHICAKWIEHLTNQETTFLAIPRITYIIFNRKVVGETRLLRQMSQTHYYRKLKLAKA